MVIRVRVKLEGKADETIETSVIANKRLRDPKARGSHPELLAKRWNLFPELPSGTRIYHIPDAIKISITTTNRVKGPVVVGAAISDKEDEVLLSDKLIDALNIALEKPGEGPWRFTDELPSKTRRSERPEKW